MSLVDSPLQLIDQAFAEHLAQGGAPGSFNTHSWLPSAVSAVASQIPSLNSTPRHLVAPNTLVRFRGMVQNSFDPDYYLDAFQLRSDESGETRVCTTRYRDSHSIPSGWTAHVDTPQCAFARRYKYYCVPIPGENAWVKQLWAQASPNVSAPQQTASSLTSKRRLDDEDEEADDDMGAESSSHQAASSSTSATEAVASEESGVKRLRPQGASLDASTASTSLDLNNTLGDDAQPLIINVYPSPEDNNDEDPFKLHDIVDVIGVLTLEPSMAPEEEAMGEDGFHTRLPPSSLVPRLHVVAHQLVSHGNPLLPAEISSDVTDQVLASVAPVRAALMQHLTGIFGGDNLAAEFMLMNMVSSVVKRDVGSEVLVGKLAINFSQVLPERRGLIDSLHTTLSGLMVKSHSVPLSLEYLNSARFTPVKNNSLGRLDAGVLQLTTGTHLLVDETALQPGQLQERGIKNVRALQQLITEQCLAVEFEYHEPIRFPSDVAAVVLSEGKSIFTVDVHLPVLPDGSAEVHGLSDEAVETLRRFFTCVRYARHTILPEVHETLQADFVTSRQRNPNISGETFHRWLTLARLLALSHGTTNLTAEHYFAAKTLDEAAQARVAALPSRTAAAPGSTPSAPSPAARR